MKTFDSTHTQTKDRSLVDWGVFALSVALVASIAGQRPANGAIVAKSAPQEAVLYSFQGAPNDGAFPQYGLSAGKAGVFYGATTNGGRGCGRSLGCGVVFKLTPARGGYTESVLYRFPGHSDDGVAPNGPLMIDDAGALYGTTGRGGAKHNGGVVFKLTPTPSGSYTETILHSFLGGSDGIEPKGPLLADHLGGIYGTTYAGGGACGVPYGCGTVYKLTPSRKSYSESILYRFKSGSDAAGPSGGLIADATGTLFGTSDDGGYHGLGTVFKLTPGGSGYAESVIYRFGGPLEEDGMTPVGGLVLDQTGALYGTTYLGGSNRCVQRFGCGTVFKLTPSGANYVESVLYRFQRGLDGANPFAALISDKAGALYGTTTKGAYQRGTVFKLTPSGSGYSESILYRFRNQSGDGRNPYGGLLAGAGGALYGTTANGGSTGHGTAFKLTL
jgi:uncharacterized repeat protein (TIGR03803 family)